ncbi:serine-rich adhesin for platelets-like [Xenopus laevis]|uniref:Serine-rich adhesin for platelets-like n=1 Tax=Xenopus laevis TaxID=8355 RepID=A0A8J1LJU2_XENLA|nr:serine-rich adhesin for platelets-like [Xenopus laevis]
MKQFGESRMILLPLIFLLAVSPAESQGLLENIKSILQRLENIINVMAKLIATKMSNQETTVRPTTRKLCIPTSTTHFKSKKTQSTKRRTSQQFEERGHSTQTRSTEQYHSSVIFSHQNSAKQRVSFSTGSNTQPASINIKIPNDTIQTPSTKHSDYRPPSVSENSTEKYTSAVTITQKNSSSTGYSSHSTFNSYSTLSSIHKTNQTFSLKTMIFQSTEENKHSEPTSRAVLPNVTIHVTHMSRTSNRNAVPSYANLTISHLLSNSTERSSSTSTGSSSRSASNSYSPPSATHETISKPILLTTEENKHSEPTSRSEMSYFAINTTHMTSNSNRSTVSSYPTVIINHMSSNNTESSSSTSSRSMPTSNNHPQLSSIYKTIHQPSSLKTTMFKSTEENKHSGLTSRAELSYFTMNTTHMSSSSKRSTVPSYPSATISHLLSNNIETSSSIVSSDSPLSAIHETINQSSVLKTAIFQMTEENKHSEPTSTAEVSYVTLNVTHMLSTNNRSEISSYPTVTISHMSSNNTESSSSTSSRSMSTSNNHPQHSSIHKTIHQPFSLKTTMFKSTEENKHSGLTSRAELSYFTMNTTHMSSSSKRSTVPSYPSATISHLLSNNIETSSSIVSSDSPLSAIHETINQSSVLKTAIFQMTEENKHSEPTSTAEVSYVTLNVTHMLSTNNRSEISSYPTVTISHMSSNNTESSSSTSSRSMPTSNNHPQLSSIYKTIHQPSSLKTTMFKSTEENKHSGLTSRAELSYFTMNTTHMSSSSKRSTVPSYPSATISHLLSNNIETSSSIVSSDSPLSAIHETINQSSVLKTAIFQMTEENKHSEPTSTAEVSYVTLNVTHMLSTNNRSEISSYPTVTISHMSSNNTESSSSTSSRSMSTSNNHPQHSSIHKTIHQPFSLKTTMFKSTEENKHSGLTSRAELSYFTMNTTHMSSSSKRSTVPSYPSATISHLLSNNIETSSSIVSSDSPLSAIHETINQSSVLKTAIFQMTEENKHSEPTSTAEVSYVTLNVTHMLSTNNRSEISSYPTVTISHMSSNNTESSSSTSSRSMSTSNNHPQHSSIHKTIHQPFSLKTTMFKSTEENKHSGLTSRAELSYFTMNTTHMSSSSKRSTVPSYPSVTISHLLSNNIETSSSIVSSDSPLSAIHETINQSSVLKTAIFQMTEENKHSEPTSTAEVSYVTLNVTHMLSTNNRSEISSYPTVTISHMSSNNTESSSSTSSRSMPTSNNHPQHSSIHKTISQPSSLTTTMFKSTEENKHSGRTSRAELSYFTMNTTHMSSSSNRSTVPSYPSATISHLLSNNIETSSSIGSSNPLSSNSYSPLSAIHETISQSSVLKTAIFQMTEENKHSEPTSTAEVSYVTLNVTRMLSTNNRSEISSYPTVTISHMSSNNTESSSSTSSRSMPTSNNHPQHSSIHKTISQPSSLTTTMFKSTEENKHSGLTSRAELSYFTMNTTHMSSSSNRSTVPSYPSVTISHLLSNNIETSSSIGSSNPLSSNSYFPLSAIHETINQSSVLKTAIFQMTEENRHSEPTSTAEVSYVTMNATHVSLTSNRSAITSYPTVTISHISSDNTESSYSTSSSSISTSSNYSQLSTLHKTISQPFSLKTTIFQSTKEKNHSELTNRADTFNFTMSTTHVLSVTNRDTTPSYPMVTINHLFSNNTENSLSTGFRSHSSSNSYSPVSAIHKTIGQTSSLKTMIFQSTEKNKHLKPTSIAEISYFTRNATHMSSTIHRNMDPSYSTVPKNHLSSNNTESISMIGSSSQSTSNSYSPLSAINETISQPFSFKNMIVQSTEENEPSGATNIAKMSYFTRNATQLSITNNTDSYYPTVTISHLLSNSTESSSITDSISQSASNSYSPLFPILNTSQPASLKTIIFQSTEKNKHSEPTSIKEIPFFTSNDTYMSSTFNMDPSYSTVTVSHLLSNSTESYSSTGFSQPAFNSYSPLSAIHTTKHQPFSLQTILFQSSEENKHLKQTSRAEISSFTKNATHVSSSINRKTVSSFPALTISHLLSSNIEISSNAGYSSQTTSNAYSPLSAIPKTISQPSLLKTVISQSTLEHKHSQPTSKAEMSYFTRDASHMSSTSSRNAVPSYPTVTISHLLSNSTESPSIFGTSHQPASNSYSSLSTIHRTVIQPSSLKTTIFQNTEENTPSESTTRAELSYITKVATRMPSTNNLTMVPSYSTVTISQLLLNNTESSASSGSSSQPASNSYPPLSAIHKSTSQTSVLQTMILQSTKENKHSEPASRAEMSYFTINANDTTSTSNRNAVSSKEITNDPTSTEITEKWDSAVTVINLLSTKIKILAGTDSSNSEPSAINTISQHTSTNTVKHVNTEENSQSVTTENEKVLKSTGSISQPLTKHSGTSHSIISHNLSKNTIPTNIKSSSYTTFGSNQEPSFSTETIKQPLSPKDITYNSTEQSKNIASTKNTKTSHSFVTISNQLLTNTWISSSVEPSIESASISYIETFPSTDTVRQPLSITSVTPLSKEGNKDLASFNTTEEVYPTTINSFSSFMTSAETLPSEVNKGDHLITSLNTPSKTESSNQSVSTSNTLNSTKATSQPPSTKSVTPLIGEGSNHSIPFIGSETTLHAVSLSTDILSAIFHSTTFSTIIPSATTKTIIQTLSTNHVTSPDKKETSHFAQTNNKLPLFNTTSSYLLSTSINVGPRSQSSSTSIMALSNTFEATSRLPSTKIVSLTNREGKNFTLPSSGTERTHPAVSASQHFLTRTVNSSANGTIIHSVPTSNTVPFHTVGAINQTASATSVASLGTKESKHSKSTSNTETPMLKITNIHLLPTILTISSSSGLPSQSAFKSNTALIKTNKTTRQLSGTDTTNPIVSFHHLSSPTTRVFTTIGTNTYYDLTRSTVDSHSAQMPSTKSMSSRGENESNHSTYKTKPTPSKVTLSNMLTAGITNYSITGPKSESASTGNIISNITEATSQQSSTNSVTSPSSEGRNYSELASETGKTYSTVPINQVLSASTKKSSSIAANTHSVSTNNILLSNATGDKNQTSLTKSITSSGKKGNFHSAITNNTETNQSKVTYNQLFSIGNIISTSTGPISQPASTISIALLNTTEATNQLHLTTRVTTPNNEGNKYSEPANTADKTYPTVPISNVLFISTSNYSAIGTTTHSDSTTSILPSQTVDNNQITLTKKENYHSATTENNKTTYSEYEWKQPFRTDQQSRKNTSYRILQHKQLLHQLDHYFLHFLQYHSVGSCSGDHNPTIFKQKFDIPSSFLKHWTSILGYHPDLFSCHTCCRFIADWMLFDCFFQKKKT